MQLTLDSHKVKGGLYWLGCSFLLQILEEMGKCLTVSSIETKEPKSIDYLVVTHG